MKPLISIIIPCYNQAHFLQECIKSVHAQTYPNWECIIVNDASADHTIEIGNALANSDQRIQLVSNEQNLGLAGSRNVGIALASGTFILPLDADDKIAPTYIAAAMASFSASPATKLVYAQAEYFGDASGPWALPAYHYALLFGRNPIYCSAIFRKADWGKVGGYNEALKTGLEDWDFWLQLLEPNDLVIQLPFTGFYYRQHGQSMIKALAQNNTAYQKAKADMLLRHSAKWLDWSANYLTPLLEAHQRHNELEKKIAKSLAARVLYKMAKKCAGK